MPNDAMARWISASMPCGVALMKFIEMSAMMCSSAARRCRALARRQPNAEIGEEAQQQQRCRVKQLAIEAGGVSGGKLPTYRIIDRNAS